MFKRNEKLRAAGETVQMTPDLQKEWLRCASDLLYFIENYYYIITLDDGKQIMQPYEYQRKALKCFTDVPNNKSHLIANWPRQMGKTTVVGAYILHYILFNQDKTVAIMANKQDTAIEIMSRIKIAYEELPLWLQQGIEDNGWNSKSIHLENGSKVFSSSTSSSSISGKSVNLLYIDEFSKIPSHVAEQFITATYPVISSGNTTKIIITSTPLGLNHFYEFWKGAVDKKNNFYPMKVNWWNHPKRDKKWKEKVIRDIGKLRFAQEYSCKFLGSSSTLIDSDVLEMIKIEDPIDYKWSGAFAIYENPIPDVLYVLGVDTAKGVGKDSSVVQVLKIIDSHSIEQVAVYRNDKISPYDYADVVIAISQFYNGAEIMLENNGEGGETATTIWHEKEYDKLCNCDAKGLGIRSTRSSKLAANLLLKQYTEKEWLKIVDERTLFELSRYIEIKPNVFQAESETCHDDAVTSLLWALYYLKTQFFDGISKGGMTDGNFKNELDNNERDAPAVVFDNGGMHSQQIFGNSGDFGNIDLGL